MARLYYLLLPISLFFAAQSYQRLDEIIAKKPAPKVDEALYLPSGKALRFISFGFRNVLAHTLWFQTINYFGRHYQSDRNYDWLSHMCNLVIELNPRMYHPYEFCSLMLSWEADRFKEATAILNRGIRAFPRHWKLPYLRGMTYLIFHKDEIKAKEDFVRSARLPGAHKILVGLAAKKISLSDSKEAAIAFLEEMIENSEQEMERAALISKLEEIKKEKFERDENAERSD